MINIIEEKENNDEKSGVADDEVSTESKDNDAKNIRRGRRSMYQAGIPDQPMDSSMLLSGDQTKMFRPDVESTFL